MEGIAKPTVSRIAGMGFLAKPRTSSRRRLRMKSLLAGSSPRTARARALRHAGGELGPTTDRGNSSNAALSADVRRATQVPHLRCWLAFPTYPLPTERCPGQCAGERTNPPHAESALPKPRKAALPIPM